MSTKNSRNAPKTIASIIILIMSSIFLFSCCLSCYAISHHPLSSLKKRKNAFPISSFVKIYRYIEVIKCIPLKNTPCNNGTTFVSTGSGTVIASGDKGSLILTAGHMCDIGLSADKQKLIQKSSKTIRLHNTKDLKFTAIVIYKKLKNDIDLCTLFSSSMINHPHVTVSDSAPVAGDMAYNIASPDGIFHPPAVPLLSGIYSGGIKDKNIDMYTIPAIGGSSGSPIFNSDFRLIGIIFASSTVFPHFSLSTKYKEMIKFINQSLRKKTKSSSKKKTNSIKELLKKELLKFKL